MHANDDNSIINIHIYTHMHQIARIFYYVESFPTEWRQRRTAYRDKYIRKVTVKCIRFLYGEIVTAIRTTFTRTGITLNNIKLTKPTTHIK